jgi:hypothetical protein
VLCNHKHAVHRELRATQRQRQSDTGEERNAVLRQDFGTDVGIITTCGGLVQVHRNDLQPRAHWPMVRRNGVQQLPHANVDVAVWAVNGADDGNPHR